MYPVGVVYRNYELCSGSEQNVRVEIRKCQNKSPEGTYLEGIIPAQMLLLFVSNYTQANITKIKAPLEEV